jgi:soluble lytic murein transglycosylase-like protein
MSLFAATEEQIVQIAHEAASRHGLPPLLVQSVIQVESGGDVWAWNAEPRYRWFWDVRANKPFRPVTAAESAAEVPPKDFMACKGVDPDAEWWGQQASWGLMQVMGAVARERGFPGRFLNALHDPVANVDIGCKHLAAYAKSYLGKYGWAGVLRAYNGGPDAAVHNTNPGYPARVCALIDGGLPHA